MVMRSCGPGRPGAARTPDGITYGAANPAAAAVAVRFRNALRDIGFGFSTSDIMTLLFLTESGA